MVIPDKYPLFGKQRATFQFEERRTGICLGRQAGLEGLIIAPEMLEIDTHLSSSPSGSENFLNDTEVNVA